MTRNEMSDIVDCALNSYDWSNHQAKPLPDHITDAIVAAQPDQYYNSVSELRRKHLDAMDAIDRLTKDRSEMKRRLEEALGGANAEIARLKSSINEWRESFDALKRQMENARAATPHCYSPSAMHMGDCSICGNSQDAPQHDVAEWKMRAERAEKRFEASEAHRKELRRRLDKAEATIAAIKETLR